MAKQLAVREKTSKAAEGRGRLPATDNTLRADPPRSTTHTSGTTSGSTGAGLTTRQRHLVENMADEQLVLRAQAGDGHATEFILTKYKQLVLQHARPYYIVGADREDLLQEGMIGLFKAIRDFIPEKGHPFPGFAGICIRRQIITAIKAASRLKCLPLNTAQSLEGHFTEEGETGMLDTLLESSERAPEEIWFDRLTTENIRRSMKRKLSRLEYESVAMYAAGLSYHEIAKLMGCQSRTIDRALFRGKRKVRGILASKEA